LVKKMPAARKKIARQWKRKLEKETGLRKTNVGVYGSRKKAYEKFSNDAYIRKILFEGDLLSGCKGGFMPVPFRGGRRNVVFIDSGLRGRKREQAAAHEIGHALYEEAQLKYHRIYSKGITQSCISEGYAISAQIEGFLSFKGETKKNLQKAFKYGKNQPAEKNLSPEWLPGMKLAMLILQAAPYNPKKRSEIRAAIARTKFKSFRECMNFVGNNFLKKKAVKK